MNKSQILAYITEEISWHRNNKAASGEGEGFERGFIAGLEHVLKSCFGTKVHDCETCPCEVCRQLREGQELMSLVIFDKDGTLVGVPDPAANRPANTPEEQVLLPGVKEAVRWYRKEGYKIAIASNQGGVAWGFITLAQADALMLDCACKIGGAHAYAFCPHDDRKNAPCECRKPRPGMLLGLMRRFNMPPSDCLMVGDQESDLLAAQAAGCDFEWASEFFGYFR